MLAEWIDYLRQPSQKLIRDMGYVYSSIALSRRARRQSQNWSDHLLACQKFWTTTLQQFSPKRLAILGSGPLVEVPLQDILSQVEEVHLVDILQPLAVRKKWKHESRVFLHEMDVTGLVEGLKAVSDPPEVWGFHPPLNELSVDLVVSANLISQLSLEPVWYLSRKWKVAEDHPSLSALIQKLGDDHLHYLRSFGVPAVLYTDVERTYRDPQGEILEVHPSRVPDLPAEFMSWTWPLCPLGEISKKFSMEMTVKAFII